MIYDPHEFRPTWDKDPLRAGALAPLVARPVVRGRAVTDRSSAGGLGPVTGRDGGAPQAAARAAAPPAQTGVDARRIVL